MGETCEECREWKKHLFWTYFNPTKVHIFPKVLLHDFHLRLAIPRNVVNAIREKLSETVDLKDSSGNIWSVGLRESGDDLFFEQGWKEFVRDHSLEKHDMVIFRYDDGGDSYFHVLVYDQNGCEKEGSDSTGESETSVEILDSPPITSHLTQSQRGRNLSKKKKKKKKKDRKGDTNDNDHPETSQQRQSSRLTELRSRKHPSPLVEPKIKAEPDTVEGHIDTGLSYSLYYVSKRRPVTDVERRNCKLSACGVVSTKINFIAVMQPSHVCRKFFLTIPQEVVRETMSWKTKAVILRVPPSSKTWITGFHYRAYSAGIYGKWADFVMDNNLEEGDVCLFELCGEGQRSSNSITMDVSIFRVVEEVVPLTRVKLPPVHEVKKPMKLG